MGCWESKNQVEPSTTQSQVIDTSKLIKKNEILVEDLDENKENKVIETSSQNNKDKVEVDDETEKEEWLKLIEKLMSDKQMLNYALSKNHSDFQTLEDLVNFLKKYPTKNDVEKAWLVYVWITNNIVYDIIGYQTGNRGKNDAHDVLKSGKAVCEGYSNLFKDTCKLLNIECIYINGHSKGIGYKLGNKFNGLKPMHAWNAVKLENKWYYVESTWGSAESDDKSKNKEFEPHYFMTPPSIFVEKHYSYSSVLHKKCTVEDFENMPANEIHFHKLGFKCLSSNTFYIKGSSNPICIEYTSSQDCDLLANLTDENGNKISNSVIIQKDTSSSRKIKYCLIVFVDKINKDYRLDLFGKQTGSTENSFPLMSKYILTLTNNVVNQNIPKYNVSITNEIKLNSHFSNLIYYKENPLTLQISASKKYSIIAEVKTLDEKENLDGAVLIQKQRNSSNFIFYVTLPVVDERMILKLYAKKGEDEGNSYPFIGNLYLVKTQQSTDKQNEITRFVNTYSQDKFDYFVFNPINYYLKTNQIYKFKIYLKNALELVLIHGENWYYFEKTDSDEDVYIIEKDFSENGELKLSAKFDHGNTYSTLCSYEIIQN